MEGKHDGKVKTKTSKLCKSVILVVGRFFEDIFGGKVLVEDCGWNFCGDFWWKRFGSKFLVVSFW